MDKKYYTLKEVKDKYFPNMTYEQLEFGSISRKLPPWLRKLVEEALEENIDYGRIFGKE